MGSMPDFGRSGALGSVTPLGGGVVSTSESRGLQFRISGLYSRSLLKPHGELN